MQDKTRGNYTEDVLHEMVNTYDLIIDSMGPNNADERLRDIVAKFVVGLAEDSPNPLKDLGIFRDLMSDGRAVVVP